MLRFLKVIILFLTVPLVSFASGLETNWPQSPLGTELTSDTQIHELIAYIYEWGISLGGVAVFAILIIAGIEYMGSAGDPAKMSAALTRIKNGVLGLILLLTSWLVLNTINPQLTTIRELPNLWELNGDYSDLVFGSTNNQGVPCDYIIVWDEEDYKGNKSVVSFGSDETIKMFDGKNAIQAIGDPWASVKSYRKLSDREKEIITSDRYDANGNPNNSGDYVSGGICQLKLYHYSDGWFSSSCGMLMGSTIAIDVPNVNAINQNTEEEQEYEEVGCIHLVRSGSSGDLVVYNDDEEGEEDEGEEDEDESSCRTGEYEDINGNCVCAEGSTWCHCANACVPTEYAVPAGESCAVTPSCSPGQFYLLGANRCVVCPPDCYWCECLDAVVGSKDDCMCE